jgi:hypothetical protein
MPKDEITTEARARWWTPSGFEDGPDPVAKLLSSDDDDDDDFDATLSEAGYQRMVLVESYCSIGLTGQAWCPREAHRGRGQVIDAASVFIAPAGGSAEAAGQELEALVWEELWGNKYGDHKEMVGAMLKRLEDEGEVWWGIDDDNTPVYMSTRELDEDGELEEVEGTKKTEETKEAEGATIQAVKGDAK